jgi:hypothetical protein
MVKQNFKERPANHYYCNDNALSVLLEDYEVPMVHPPRLRLGYFFRNLRGTSPYISLFFLLFLLWQFFLFVFVSFQ